MQKGRAVQRLFTAITLVTLVVSLGFYLSSARAQSANRAGLIVVHGDGRVITRCIEFTESDISGFDVLLRSGLDIVYSSYGSLGAAICAIDGEGCGADNCFCQCSGGPTCLYWSYWHLVNGTWQYSSVGASGYRVHNGDIEGWIWGSGNTPPPVMTLEEICGSPATATPEPPTSTPTPVPPSPTFTATPQPPTATATPQPPTATATPRPSTATATPQPSTATATPQPPTATATPRPSTATATPQPPTATATPRPSTATATVRPRAATPTSTRAPSQATSPASSPSPTARPSATRQSPTQSPPPDQKAMTPTLPAAQSHPTVASAAPGETPSPSSPVAPTATARPPQGSRPTTSYGVFAAITGGLLVLLIVFTVRRKA